MVYCFSLGGLYIMAIGFVMVYRVSLGGLYIRDIGLAWWAALSQCSPAGASPHFLSDAVHTAHGLHWELRG